MRPKISVIVPVYNVEKYIAESIESIVNQTFSDIEILIIDDCSTDNSYKIMQEYAQKDSRIILYHNEKNLGVSKTRNIGLDNAKGQYIAFIDSDDYTEPNLLEELYKNTINNLDAVVCVSHFHVTNGRKNRVMYTYGNFDINDNFIKLYTQKNTKKLKFSYGTWDKLYQKNILDTYKIRFYEDLKLHEDYLFNIQYFRYVKKYICIDKYLYYYRQICTSATKNFNYDFFLEQEKNLVEAVELNNNELVNILAFKAVQYVIRLAILNKNSYALKEMLDDEFFAKRITSSCIKGLNIEKKFIYYFYKLKSKIGLKFIVNITHYFYEIKERISCVK